MSNNVENSPVLGTPEQCFPSGYLFAIELARTLIEWYALSLIIQSLSIRTGAPLHTAILTVRIISYVRASSFT